MGLSQSLYTGWTGLATHQRSMDNASHNLSNVNTVGYKKSDFMFSSLFSNVVRGAMPEGTTVGATNPTAVGLGVTTGAILNNFKQGPMETTGNPLDVAINGNGFFLAGTQSGTALTRNGSFYLDHTVSPQQRMLCVGDGLPIQGWNAVNGVISPSPTVGNIYLPARGDMMPGKKTDTAVIRGILPTNTKSSDFAGRATTALDIKGNLAGGKSMTTKIYAPVTQTDGSSPSKHNEVEEINVRIDFTGPIEAADGATNTYTWTMTTVDWPNPGDPGVQIYPPAGDPEFTQGAIKFYAESSPNQQRAAGQAVEGEVKPGTSKVRTDTVLPDGTTITSSFDMPADFVLDVSRLTNLDNAPGGDALETWHVNGNPKGSMARTVTVYDEYTDFVQTTDAGGNSVMQAVRRVQARENTLHFTRTEQDDTGSHWEWSSSLDNATGKMKFNTIGDMVENSQSGGHIRYDFTDIRSINSEGAIQIIDQDGYPDGFLGDVTIDQNGKIWGHYSNNVAEPLAQIAIGTVPNPNGLEGVSGTLFYAGGVSGDIMIGIAGDQDGNLGLAPVGAGSLTAMALEGSNVELSSEFTNLINIERGYQFNSKVVTTSDELLQTALGLKR